MGIRISSCATRLNWDINQPRDAVGRFSVSIGAGGAKVNPREIKSDSVKRAWVMSLGDHLTVGGRGNNTSKWGRKELADQLRSLRHAYKGKESGSFGARHWWGGKGTDAYEGGFPRGLAPSLRKASGKKWSGVLSRGSK